jgi:TolB-like protein/Tfp pilus assembly protein PilF
MNGPENESPRASGLYAELKRRNVFRVAAAYVVIGWLTLQVADVLLGFTGAPEWVGKSLIALLLLGFVPAMALAWVFEVGPEGIRRDDGSNARHASPQARRLDTLTLIAVFFVVVLMAWQHLAPAFRTGRAADAPAPPRDSPAAVEEPRQRLEPPPFEVPEGSVAVLPFTNRSAEPDSAFFVDGIHDDLLTELARNGALKVISRTSMMEYRDTTKNLRQIGEELAVATILEGAVQRAGQRVRINAQLIDTRSDQHLWAETFDRELTPENIFDIQSEIAAAIATALGRTLGAETGMAPTLAAPTQSTQALDLYLRARTTRNEWVEPAIRKRLALYAEALEADPAFALAMGELGREHTNLYWFVTRRDADRLEGRRWLDRALALAPDDPQLRLANAEFHYRANLDYDLALAELERAARGLPGSAEVIALRAYIQRRAGRSAETLAALNAAVLLDPRSVEVLRTLVETHGMLGDVETAARWSRRLLELPGDRHYDAFFYPIVRLQRLGDTGTMGAMLEALPAGAEAEIDSFTQEAFFTVPFLERDFGRAATALDALKADLLEDQVRMAPIALLRAYLARAEGRQEDALRHARTALAQLDGRLNDAPEDYRALLARAQALAILGDAPAARESVQRALKHPTVTRDVLVRSEALKQELLTLAMVADSETVARAMGSYLELELRYWDFDGLVLDPVFDPHREHPAIRALEAKHSRRESDA